MKGLNFLELEVIQHLQNLLSGLLKVYKLFKKIENDEKIKNTGIQWTNYIDEIMVTYNYKDVHIATRLTPNKAREKDHESRANINIASKAKKERLYPNLMLGSKVKFRRKKAIIKKEKTSHFLKDKYIVESIDEKLNQKYFRLEGYIRPLMGHEFLKI